MPKDYVENRSDIKFKYEYISKDNILGSAVLMEHENLVCPSYISIIWRLCYFLPHCTYIPLYCVFIDKFTCDFVYFIKATFDRCKIICRTICFTAVVILKSVLIGGSNKVYFCFIDAQKNGLHYYYTKLDKIRMYSYPFIAFALLSFLLR